MTIHPTLEPVSYETKRTTRRIGRLLVGATLVAATSIGAVGAGPVAALEPITIIVQCIGDDCPPPPDPDPEPQVNPALGELPGDLTNCMPTDFDPDPCDNDPEVDPEVNPGLGELPGDLTNCMPTDFDPDPCDEDEEPGEDNPDGGTDGGIDDPVPGDPDFAG